MVFYIKRYDNNLNKDESITIADQRDAVGKTTSVINIVDTHGAEDYLNLCREIVGRR